MTPPPPPPASNRPRPWIVSVLVGTAIVVIVLAGCFAWLRPFKSDSQEAADTTATTTEPAPVWPTFESPEPDVTETSESPSPSPSTTSAKPSKKATTKPTRKPAPKPDVCETTEPARGNKSLINGSLRLEINENGSVTIYQQTTPSASVEDWVPDSADPPCPDVTGVDWVIRQSLTRKASDGTYYVLRYFHNSRLNPYRSYYRQGASGDWKLLGSAERERYYLGNYYQVVVFWNDPTGSSTPAPKPPNFNW